MNMFIIEIQRKIDFDDEDDELTTDTLSLAVGDNFDKATETFKLICNNNLFALPDNKGKPTVELVYIRLRVKFHDQDMVLTRRTPSGVGDW